MSHSTSFSFQIGSIQNEDLKKVHPIIRLLIYPSLIIGFSVFAINFYSHKVEADWKEYIAPFFVLLYGLYSTIHLWFQMIQIVRFDRCYGDMELYFENGKLILIQQHRKETVLTKFYLSDIEEFNLFENNSEVFIKVNSEIFTKRDGSKINSIRLKYLGDLSFALMIIEKIASEKNNGKDGGEKVLDLLGDIMREVKVARFKNVPITNLYKNITLNQRFSFVKELFKGDKNDYEMTIEKFDNSSKLEAISLLKEIGDKYNWNSQSSLVLEFSELVNRRFL